MKKIFTITLIAIIAFGKIASAQSLILHQFQNNKFATALFESVDPNGCVVTDVFVQSGETKQQVNGGGPIFNSPFTYILVQKIDLCSFEYLYYAEEVVWTGGNVENSLTNADLDITMPLTDLVSGNTENAHIVVDWKSISPMITHEFTNSHINLKGLHYSVNNHGVYREADATGSITINNGPNLIPDHAYFAYVLRGGVNEILNIHPRMGQLNGSGNSTVTGDISIFPNPATDVLHVNTTNASSYSIINTLGALVVENNNVTGKTSEEINLNNLAPGIYFLRLNTDQGQVVKKFVKE